MNSWNISSHAAALHRDALVLDMTLPWLDYSGSPFDLRIGTLTRLAASGYTFISLTIALDDSNVERVVRAIAKERAYFTAHPDNYVLFETTDDIIRAKREGKLAVGFHFQGTEPLQRDLAMVEVYYKLGVRHMLIAYNQKNSAGDGCHEPQDSKLSHYGETVVAEMNRVGMLVDVSHTGYRTSMDVIEASKDPVVFSHSNPRALVEHDRNIRDDQIKACARKGGVIGVVGCGVFLGNNDISTETFLRNIDYLVQMVGADHVGIGLDYVYDQISWHKWILQTSVGAYLERGDYLPNEVIRYVSPEQLPAVTEGLLARGYREEEVRGILGQNWLRVMGQIYR